MSADNVVDNDKAMIEMIEAKCGNDEEEGEVTITTNETVTYTLTLGDDVATEYGGASFTRDHEIYGLHHFDIHLGPANSKALVEFLLALPDEPTEG